VRARWCVELSVRLSLEARAAATDASTLTAPAPPPPTKKTPPSNPKAADLNAWLQSRLVARATTTRLAAAFAVDFALLVLPHVALTMAGAAAASPLLPPAGPCFAAVLFVWLLLVARRCVRGHNGAEKSRRRIAAALAALAEPRRKRFVSAFRGGLMLLTCASILAVDFRAFPRRLAKAENYGQGLMDVGVGAFVFAAGLVLRPAAPTGSGRSKQPTDVNNNTPRRRSARLAAAEEQQQKTEQNVGRRRRQGEAAAPPPPLPARLAKCLRASAPVAALGLARLLTTKATQYAEHVGEYGVHWNFFLTVAVVGAVAAALPPQAVATPRRAASLSALVLSLHQALLSLTPLGEWVQAEARGPGWLSLNKEGVSSLPGYVALLLLGCAAGGALKGACDEAAEAAVAAKGRRRQGEKDSEEEEEEDEEEDHTAAASPLWRLFARSILANAGLWLLALLLDSGVERISRRACNAAYVLWVSALCVSTLLACMAGEAAVAAGVAVGAGGGNGRRRQSRARSGDGGGNNTNNNNKNAAFAPLLCALNRNMLAVFLGANLLTGAVNLLTDTLAASDGRARLTASLYLLVVSAAAALLDARGVDTTRWLLRGR
jgi:phosphatidylinositol glycan class W